MANGPANIIRNDLGERSSADEGFTSGGSPVGDCGSSNGSGTVRCGRIPVLVSPDSAADTAQLVSSSRKKKASFVFHSCSSPTSSLTRSSGAEDDRRVPGSGPGSGSRTPLLAESLARESTV